MRAGLLRHRIDLQSMTRETNEVGELISTPSTYATRLPARYRPLQGRELWEAQQVQAQTEAEISIRYRADVESSHRVLLDDRVFEIVGLVNADGRNRELVLLCKETT